MITILPSFALLTRQNADGGYSHKGLNLDRFIREAEQLAHHLDMHHRIEEAYIFPLLAKKIPAFADGARTGAHINSHHKIHEGEYLPKAGEK